MRDSTGKPRGFSYLELMVVISVIGVIASFAIPQYMIYVETAQATACLVERGQTNRMIIQYSSDHLESPLTNLAQLVSAGYVDEIPHCPYGGEWILMPSDKNQGLPAIGCSLHFWPEEDSESTESNPLTSLGSTFDEITGAMIALIDQYHQENRKYPRSWGNFAFTDIGLDPDEWANAVEGMIFKPNGKRVSVTPAQGYTFYVNNAKGEQIELSSDSNWSLWYSMDKGSWYFKNTSKNNLIDISTLSVVAD